MSQWIQGLVVLLALCGLWLLVATVRRQMGGRAGERSCSVVVLVKDRPEILEDFLRTAAGWVARGQLCLEPVELVVVDAGSAEETTALLTRLSRRLPATFVNLTSRRAAAAEMALFLARHPRVLLCDLRAQPAACAVAEATGNATDSMEKSRDWDSHW